MEGMRRLVFFFILIAIGRTYCLERVTRHLGYRQDGVQINQIQDPKAIADIWASIGNPAFQQGPVQQPSQQGPVQQPQQSYPVQAPAQQPQQHDYQKYIADTLALLGYPPDAVSAYLNQGQQSQQQFQSQQHSSGQSQSQAQKQHQGQGQQIQQQFQNQGQGQQTQQQMQNQGQGQQIQQQMQNQGQGQQTQQQMQNQGQGQQTQQQMQGQPQLQIPVQQPPQRFPVQYPQQQIPVQQPQQQQVPVQQPHQQSRYPTFGSSTTGNVGQQNIPQQNQGLEIIPAIAKLAGQVISTGMEYLTGMSPILNGNSQQGPGQWSPHGQSGYRQEPCNRRHPCNPRNQHHRPPGPGHNFRPPPRNMYYG